MGQMAPPVTCGDFNNQVSRQSCLPVWRTVGGLAWVGTTWRDGGQVTSVPARPCCASPHIRRHILLPGGGVCCTLPLLGARSLSLLGGTGCSALRRLEAGVPPPSAPPGVWA